MRIDEFTIDKARENLRFKVTFHSPQEDEQITSFAGEASLREAYDPDGKTTFLKLDSVDSFRHEGPRLSFSLPTLVEVKGELNYRLWSDAMKATWGERT